LEDLRHNSDLKQLSVGLRSLGGMNTTPATTIISDPRRQAALLYWQGFSVRQIAETLSLKTPTV